MKEIKITVCGTVGTDPVVREVSGGQAQVTSFRLANTPRVRDRQTNVWRDQPTSWFQVSCWRQLGANVADCVRKGQPVVVHGRLVVREWTTDDGQPRTRAEIEADCVGHDLTWGQSSFEKVNWAQPKPAPGQRELDELAELAERATRGVDGVELVDELEAPTDTGDDAGPDPDGTGRGAAEGRALGRLVGTG